MAKRTSPGESRTIDGIKITRKHVKRAGMWMKRTEEVGARDIKGKAKIKISWHDDMPEFTAD